ncbi:MAG: hypothetical protein SW833_14190 [Cyanobacteriota bacterium]|nr:hypothetical protein [Cyanobacteriota bacterium]
MTLSTSSARIPETSDGDSTARSRSREISKERSLFTRTIVSDNYCVEGKRLESILVLSVGIFESSFPDRCDPASEFSSGSLWDRLVMFI